MPDTLLPRRSVDVGGVPFDTAVLGEGSPTVVFVNGMGSPLEEWTLVAPAIAERCRVVCYDRRQAPRQGPVPAHSAAEIAADLHQLLDALDVTGPLVMVGHSWGGAVIRRYAFDYPEDITGMVYVDATHEGLKAMTSPPPGTRVLHTGSTFLLRSGPIRRGVTRSLGFERLPAAEQALVDGLPWLADGRTGRAEFAGIATSLLELGRVAPALPSVPTRVLLAAGRPTLTTKLSGRQLATIRKCWEQAVADRNDITLQIVADSGHYISLDQPQAVIDAIDDVLTLVAQGRTAPISPGTKTSS